MLVLGDARRIPLKDGSVHMVVTSPPYYGLRDYGLPPLVWDEPAGGCAHVWGEPEREHHPGQVEQTKWQTAEAAGKGQTAKSGQFCVRCGNPEHVHEWGTPVRAPWANSIPGPSANVPKNTTEDGGHWKPKVTGACCPCGAWRGTLGLEPTPEMYVRHLVEVMREVRRVLRVDGSLWLNLGDSYAGSWGNQGRKAGRGSQRPVNGPMLSPVHDGRYPDRGSNTGAVPPGLKPKDLVGIPWRVAFALQADGWWLREDIIWSKKNCMPESIRDRCTRSHEYLFHLAKSERYYHDHVAIREPEASASTARYAYAADDGRINKGGAYREAFDGDDDHGLMGRSQTGMPQVPTDGKRNRRSVWSIATKPYKGAHFAVFPPALVEPCVLAGTSERGACASCGAPWARVVSRKREAERVEEYDGKHAGADPQAAARRMLLSVKKARDAGADHDNPFQSGVTTGWRQDCRCGADPVPCVVLDPFAGSGTVGEVCAQHGRSFVGLDLKPEYLELARKRLDGVTPNSPVVDKQGAVGKRTYSGFNARWAERAEPENRRRLHRDRCDVTALNEHGETAASVETVVTLTDLSEDPDHDPFVS
jgi:DNA modification methylase